jgi:hypothetical protein
MGGKYLTRVRRRRWVYTADVICTPITFTQPIQKFVARHAFARITGHGVPPVQYLTDYEVEVASTLVVRGAPIEIMAHKQTGRLYMVSPWFSTYDEDDVMMDVYTCTIADYIWRCMLKGFNSNQIADSIRILLGIEGISRRCVDGYMEKK